MSELDSIKNDLDFAWKEYLQDEPAALGSTILAMNRLINHLRGLTSTMIKETK